MINLKNLTKKYGNNEIISKSNYMFPQKGIVCLLGPSGCGKSTLLNLLAGFDSDYEGKILVENKDLSKLNEAELCEYRKNNIGFIFQEYHLLPGYTVLENILLTSDLNEENISKAKEILNKLSILEKKDEKIENLSGGQKQRVAIARALMKNPKTLLADEPTGALDRKTSSDIMDILKSISNDMLVVIITHDKKLCSYADEVISIKDKQISGFENKVSAEFKDNKKQSMDINKYKSKFNINTKKIANKNFKVHLKYFITVAIVIALGISSFMLSISSQNVINNSIEEFKEKNTAFNNGYIKGKDDKTVLNLLKENNRVEDAYLQYKLNDITIEVDGKKEQLPELIPMPKTEEGLSYGVMPRKSKKEIAITPSLAKKLNPNIDKLIGQKVKLQISDIEYTLTISGIYNAGYDSIFVSSDIEKELYNKVPHGVDSYSISYDVNSFEDVVFISNLLSEKNIEAITAKDQVESMMSTFTTIKRLFMIVSVLIFLVSIFISITLLSKLQNSRVREIGLMSALGVNRSQIKSIILRENIILSIVSSISMIIVIAVAIIISKSINLDIGLKGTNIILSLILNFIIVITISGVISSKLVKVEPAKALRM